MWRTDRFAEDFSVNIYCGRSVIGMPMQPQASMLRGRWRGTWLEKQGCHFQPLMIMIRNILVSARVWMAARC